jgi:hypothetical protein
MATFGGNRMDVREIYKDKIEKQLSKWKTTIDELKTRIERTEENTKGKLSEQLEGLHEKRARAEKILGEITTASHEAWEGVKNGIEQGWKDLSRTAKKAMLKVHEAVATPNRDEEIRQIAYYLWLDEGRPDGRHVEHWLRAEAIWRARQEAEQRHKSLPTRPKRPRKPMAGAPKSVGRKRALKSVAVQALSPGRKNHRHERARPRSMHVADDAVVSDRLMFHRSVRLAKQA